MGSDQVQPQQQQPQPVQQQSAAKSRGSLDGSSSGSSSEDDDDDDDVDDEDEDSLSPAARHQQSVVPSGSQALGAGSVGTPERTHRLVQSFLFSSSFCSTVGCTNQSQSIKLVK